MVSVSSSLASSAPATSASETRGRSPAMAWSVRRRPWAGRDGRQLRPPHRAAARQEHRQHEQRDRHREPDERRQPARWRARVEGDRLVGQEPGVAGGPQHIEGVGDGHLGPDGVDRAVGGPGDEDRGRGAEGVRAGRGHRADRVDLAGTCAAEHLVQGPAVAGGRECRRRPGDRAGRRRARAAVQPDRQDQREARAREEEYEQDRDDARCAEVGQRPGSRMDRLCC